MPESTGHASVCQMGVAASWGAAWSAPTIAIPFLSETFEREINKIPYDVLNGLAGRRQADMGVVRVNGDLVCALDYDNFTSLIKGAMGEETAGVITLSDSEHIQIRRMQFDKQTTRWRLGSVKFHRMVIESTADPGDAKVTFTGVAQDYTRSATAKSDLSLTGPVRLRHRDLVFRIADTVDALAAGDALAVDVFRLTLDLAYETDVFASGSELQLEPFGNSFRNASLEIGAPRYDADITTLLAAKDAGTALQADAIWTRGGQTFTVEIPQMAIDSGLNLETSGPQARRADCTLGCYRNTDNTPMAAVENEFRVTIA